MPPPSGPPIPADLKPIAPYLARASELAAAEPVISYWCTYYALQQAMSIGSQEQESQAFLFGLMDKLEALKSDNSTNDAFTDDAAAAAYVENFGLKLFSQADNEDRKAKASRLTARKFLAAANFLELLSIFGDVGADNRDKIKYSKWKAADIAKAFREGRTPVPGPAGGLSAEEEHAPETSRVTADEEKELARELAALGTGKAPGPGPAADGAGSAPSTAEAGEADEPADYPFPQQPTALPAVPSAPDFIDDEPEPEPDFTDAAPPPLPSAPGSAPFEYDPSPSSDTSHAATPALPSFLEDTPAPRSPAPPPLLPPSAVSPPAAPATPQIPETHQTSTLHPPSTHLPSEPPAFPSAVFPPSAPAPPAPAASAPPQAQRREEESYDPMTVAKVQKHARWAISALDYEDWETARRELRGALAMLGG
ncbi:hypothetical protein JCM6882_000487 [Rhodosporidiobolus microsporus]